MIRLLQDYAAQYNDWKYFTGDPIIFPKHFAGLMAEGKATIQDVEVAAAVAAHLAWGRRDMIVRDCRRAMDEMGWQPYEYVKAGHYRDDDTSLHRTVKWSEFAGICRRIKEFYDDEDSMEVLSPGQMRVRIYGQKDDPSAANKKIHMLRRWMVRNDGKVDLGLWKNISPRDLIIPLDVHVHRTAVNLGITARRSAMPGPPARLPPSCSRHSPTTRFWGILPFSPSPHRPIVENFLAIYTAFSMFFIIFVCRCDMKYA